MQSALGTAGWSESTGPPEPSSGPRCRKPGNSERSGTCPPSAGAGRSKAPLPNGCWNDVQCPIWSIGTILGPHRAASPRCSWQRRKSGSAFLPQLGRHWAGAGRACGPFASWEHAPRRSVPWWERARRPPESDASNASGRALSNPLRASGRYRSPRARPEARGCLSSTSSRNSRSIRHHRSRWPRNTAGLRSSCAESVPVNASRDGRLALRPDDQACLQYFRQARGPIQVYVCSEDPAPSPPAPSMRACSRSPSTKFSRSFVRSLSTSSFRISSRTSANARTPAGLRSVTFAM